MGERGNEKEGERETDDVVVDSCTERQRTRRRSSESESLSQ